MDDTDRGPELAEFRVNPRHVDKAKRVLREILKDAKELCDNTLHLPFRPDNGIPLNWLCGYDPDGNLVLTVRLKTREVELID